MIFGLEEGRNYSLVEIDGEFILEEGFTRGRILFIDRRYMPRFMCGNSWYESSGNDVCMTISNGKLCITIDDFGEMLPTENETFSSSGYIRARLGDYREYCFPEEFNNRLTNFINNHDCDTLESFIPLLRKLYKILDVISDTLTHMSFEDMARI